VNLRIVCAGRTPKPHEARWLEEYLTRAKPFAKIDLVRVRERPSENPERTARRTWEEIEEKIPPQSFRVLLDPKGKLLSTAEFSALFDRAEKTGRKGIAFVVGGSYGLPPEAARSADFLLSLTPLTLPHRLALLILCEQIYRVLSWRAGAPYHHDS
jgi:23S rRNA (pseudouridine1915-N3)-methyltransferase